MFDRKADSTTYTTPERRIKRESQISTIAKTSRKHELVTYETEPNDKTNYYYECNIKITHKIEKVQKIKRKQKIRQVLGKMIFAKQITLRRVFANFKSLISTDILYISGGSHPERQIAEDLIWKSKPNLQGSLMRSVLKLQHKNPKGEERSLEKKELAIGSRINVMVYPDQLSSIRTKEKEGILMLILYMRQNVGSVLRKFQKNMEYESIKYNYCRKVFAKRKQNYKTFIEKLRLVVTLNKELILGTKRKTMSEVLNKCFMRRDKIFSENIKNCHLIVEIRKKETMKKMMKNSSMKLLQTLNLWFRNANINKKQQVKLTINKTQAIFVYNQNPQEKSQSNLKQSKFIKKNKHFESSGVSVGTGDPLKSESIEIQAGTYVEVDEKVKERRENLLKRIIMKKHVQKWAFHARFRRNLQKCSISLACASKISIQNSFWRLNVNAYHKQ